MRKWRISTSQKERRLNEAKILERPVVRSLFHIVGALPSTRFSPVFSQPPKQTKHARAHLPRLNTNNPSASFPPSFPSLHSATVVHPPPRYYRCQAFRTSSSATLFMPFPATAVAALSDVRFTFARPCARLAGIEEAGGWCPWW